MWWGFSRAGSAFSLRPESAAKRKLPSGEIVAAFTFQPLFLCNNGLFEGPLHICYELPPPFWDCWCSPVVPGMKKRGWGRIINTASAHSLVASPFKSAYVAAKHGIAGLTKTVALELATFKITCNAISPGYVWTPLVERQIPDTMKARNMTKDQVIKDVMLLAQPTKEFVTSEQVAALALYLCGDDASQITGANLSIDGGWTAA